jgi:hypothetical protein
MSRFPGVLVRYFLRDFDMVSNCPYYYWYHLFLHSTCYVFLLLSSLYFRIFSASFFDRCIIIIIIIIIAIIIIIIIIIVLQVCNANCFSNNYKNRLETA